ncbi:unnamed protein product [Mytilus coruscus]|uniref:Uncharacterized protein n=1 Tax=Mytilus coruscus TaxID=42192 RepID=A0A6J8BEA2_MYTCO|nr:unnamed protein product [Mytilus coruscus]
MEAMLSGVFRDLYVVTKNINSFKQQSKKPQCSCNKHEEFSKDTTVHKRSARKIAKHLDEILVEKGFLSDRAVYLCTACSNYAYENFVVPPKEKRAKYSSHYIDTTIELIESDIMNDDDLLRLVFTIWKKKRGSLVSESNRASQQYKDDDFLNSYKPGDWKDFISQRLKLVWGEPDLVKENVSSKTSVYRQAEVDRSFDKYRFINDTSSKQPSSVVLGDPLMKNPCSYNAVNCVLDSILETTCKTRQWSIAGCDGSPYILGSRLMDKSFCCHHGKTDFNNNSNFIHHLKESHNAASEVYLGRKYGKYGKLLLIPG